MSSARACSACSARWGRKPYPGRQIYPYLLRNRSIERANHVWAAEICYIPMAKGFMYLVAILDWHSRRVLCWRLSNTLDTDFCLQALHEALRRFGAPEIFNTDSENTATGSLWWSALRGVKHQRVRGAGRPRSA